MRVAIAGAGNVGSFIAQDLRDDGHEVLLIEENPDVASRLRDSIDVTWFVGDACEVSKLHAAGVEGVDVMVAATGDDEDNLVVSLLAKQEFAVPRVIARVNHPKNHWLFNESWGVDVAVSTPHLLTSLVEEAVSVGSLVRLLTFEGGGARLVEVTLSDKSPAINQTVAELGVPRDASLVAVVRGGHVVVPRRDTVLFGGGELRARLG
jgi:trk system potassium uptake protein TrkA